MPNPANVLVHKFTESWGLPFRDLLPQSEIEQVLNVKALVVSRQRLGELMS